jgi:hypothetical protein
MSELRGEADVSPAGPVGFVEAFDGVFQVAYVTHDRGEAEREFVTRFGVRGWTELDVDVFGAQLAVAFARAGRVQIELIQPVAGDTALFSELLPQSGLVKVHHLGVRVDDIELALVHADAAGYACRRSGGIEGQLRFAFVDTTSDLGHYIELAQFTPAGWSSWPGFSTLTSRQSPRIARRAANLLPC